MQNVKCIMQNYTHSAILHTERTGYSYKICDDNVLIGECHECGDSIYSEYCGDALVTDSGVMFCCRECCDEFYGIRKVDV